MSYPSIIETEFNKKITKKFIKYKIPKEKRTFNEICFPNKFELQLPQKFLAQYMGPETPYQGILVLHKIGSGKTCTSINIAEQWKYIRNIVVVLPASLIGNYRGELRSQCAGNTYISKKDREKLKILQPTSKEYKEIIFKSDNKIDKYYSIYSYNKFIDLAKNNKMNLKNTVLIIDEIQNMVSEKGIFYKILYKTIHNAPKDLKIVLLSATPIFDQPSEIALTMNLLRLPSELPIGSEFNKMFINIKKNSKTGKYTYSVKNLDIFKEKIKGYVSYFRGAPQFVFPDTKIKYVDCEMSEFQYKSYITVLDKEKHNIKYDRIKIIKKFTSGEILNLPSNFFLGLRIISNVSFPNKDIGEKGFKSFTGKSLELENLKNYSIKFYKIIKKINICKGPVYVYSNFLNFGGLKSFSKVLKAYGYKNYNKYGQGKKRYCYFTGEEKQQLKEEIKTVYNHINNLNGSKIKILLLSPSAKEGLSLFNVRQAHILEPYWNYSRIQQIIGRGSRYCSHKNLPEDQRNCKVYIYVAIHENEKETVDQYIVKLAKKKNKLISQFEIALKEIAIDCTLNINANVVLESEKLFCDI